jgi:NADH dehydrogenase
VLPTLELTAGDAREEQALMRAFDGMDAAVNLVGILHPGRGQSFESLHAELPGRVARAARASGIQHLAHVSALGASAAAPSEYLRTKAAGEASLRAEAGPVPWTVLRPSVMFGQGDRFLNLFATLVRLFPVIPLAAAHARFQPIWVEDVARCCLAALGDARSAGRVLELCGPRSYTLAELVRTVATTLGRRRAIVPLPAALGELQAFVLEHLPGHLMTRDNLRSMSVDSVCSGWMDAPCAFEPAALEAVLADYLGSNSAEARYARYRDQAGR